MEAEPGKGNDLRLLYVAQAQVQSSLAKEVHEERLAGESHLLAVGGVWAIPPSSMISAELPVLSELQFPQLHNGMSSSSQNFYFRTPFPS